MSADVTGLLRRTELLRSVPAEDLAAIAAASGELSIADGGARSIDAETLEDCELLPIRRDRSVGKVTPTVSAARLTSQDVFSHAGRRHSKPE